MTIARSGTSKRMTTGNPIAAKRVRQRIVNTTREDTHTYGLCDGKGRTKADELDGDEQQQARFADFVERLVGRGERFVSDEVEQFEGDTVALKGVRAHVPAIQRV